MPAFGDASADTPHFGHTLEMDSSPADIMTKDGKRLAVIGAIDVYSRRAVMLIAQTSKSIAIAACMRKAILAWGIPSRIRKDNGKDYVSYHIQAVTSSFKISAPELPKYSPEKKPFIERFFGTFATSFEELLPGFIGHDVQFRKALQAKETWGAKFLKPGSTVEVPLTMEEFQALTDRFIETYEKTTPHSGIGDKTPLEKARESQLQPQKIRDERLLDILLAPTGQRMVRKKGISLDGTYFTSPELIEFIGHTIDVRRDLSDAGIIYLFDASGKYLCNAKNEPLQGQALADYIEAKKKHVRALKSRVKMLDKLGLPNRTPLQILLEDDLEHSESNVIPFQGNFENETTREVKKAVSDTASDQAVDVVPRQISKAVNGYDLDSLIDNSSYMTEADYAREFEELKKNRDKKSMRVR